MGAKLKIMHKRKKLLRSLKLFKYFVKTRAEKLNFKRALKGVRASIKYYREKYLRSKRKLWIFLYSRYFFKKWGRSTRLKKFLMRKKKSLYKKLVKKNNSRLKNKIVLRIQRSTRKKKEFAVANFGKVKLYGKHLKTGWVTKYFIGLR